MYITICKTDDHVSLMHDAGHPELVLLDNLEGWGGEGGRKETLHSRRYLKSLCDLD